MTQKNNNHEEENTKKSFTKEFDEYKKKQTEQKKSEDDIKNSTKEETPKPEILEISVEDLNKIKYQLAEIVNKYKELEREFDNYRKRTREEIKQAKLDGQVKIVEAILPALDTFKKAKDIIKDERSIEGINLIEKNLLVSLEKQNVKKIDCIGKPFDPNMHNAVLLVEDKNAESGTIVQELETGFVMGEKVVKYSQVVVAK